MVLSGGQHAQDQTIMEDKVPDFVFRCRQCRYNFRPPGGIVEATDGTCPLCGGSDLTKGVARDETIVLETGRCGNDCFECAD